MCKWYDGGVIAGFKDDTTRDIYDGTNSKAARRIPAQVWGIAQRKLDSLNAAAALKDLTSPPGNRLEALKGRLAGYHSIRINDQYRICFVWRDREAHQVEVVDYH